MPDDGAQADAAVSEPRPHVAGRTLAEFTPLLDRERDLLAVVRDGRRLELGVRPVPGTADRRIRGRFLRFLALGGDGSAVVHENGINLVGAWIDGPVALDNVAGKVFLAFKDCAFDALTATDAALPMLALEGSRVAGALDASRLACPAGLYWGKLEVEGTVTLDDARIGLLQLDGARLAFGLRAQRLVCAGGIYLRDGFRAGGPVDLILVEAGNDLDCSSGSFANPLFAAIDAGKLVARPPANAPGAEAATRAAVVDRLAGELANATRFDAPPLTPADARVAVLRKLYAPPFDAGGTGTATPALELSGATIKGNLFLTGAIVVGRVNATVARIGLLTADDAQLLGVGGTALDLTGATVEGALRLYGAATVAGAVVLRAAAAGTLQVEASARWAGNARFELAGFVYPRLDIEGDAPRYSDWAAAWIRGGAADGAHEFRPQPWDQLIAALRAGGHPLDATRLAITKEDEYRTAGKVVGARRTLHWLHGRVVGYGYKPEWLVGWLVVAWLAAGLLFLALGPQVVDGLLVPAKAAVASNCLVDRVIARDRHPCPATGDDPTFLPWSYSADLLVPGLHLGDADEWKLAWRQDGPHWLLRRLGVAVLFAATWIERIFGGAGFSVLAVVVGGYLLKRRD